jgi:membrane fusion protein (multidrug efflux system)
MPSGPSLASRLLPAALATLAISGCGRPPAAAPGPVVVEVAPVVRRDVPVVQEWVATLHGFVDAQIRAQVSGYLLRQDYHDGAVVHKGDLLFEIDARPFRAALAQAEASDAEAVAQAGKTQEDVRRYGPLAREQAISEQEYDDAVQANLAAQAQVAAARAAVEQARLNLDFTRITSPVDGIAGIVQAQVGDLVGPTTGVLTTVSAVDPIKVYFPISEQTYLDANAGHAADQGFPGDVPLQLILADGSVYPFPGQVTATDREIDPNTGTLLIEALFPNPQRLLRPGQYGRVRGVVRTLPGALVIPQRAASELQGAYQVAVVDASNTARLRTVKLGPTIGSDVVVTSGLGPDDRIIVEGSTKVRDGTPVDPKPFQPAADAAGE